MTATRPQYIAGLEYEPGAGVEVVSRSVVSITQVAASSKNAAASAVSAHDPGTELIELLWQLWKLLSRVDWLGNLVCVIGTLDRGVRADRGRFRDRLHTAVELFGEFMKQQQCAISTEHRKPLLKLTVNYQVIPVIRVSIVH
jgi:hypothetical protein